MRCDKQVANSLRSLCIARMVKGGMLNLILRSMRAADAQVLKRARQLRSTCHKQEPTFSSTISPQSKNNAMSSTGLVSHAYSCQRDQPGSKVSSEVAHTLRDCMMV